eukprot:873759-Pleurochrysis_carterae.AAC.3
MPNSQSVLIFAARSPHGLSVAVWVAERRAHHDRDPLPRVLVLRIRPVEAAPRHKSWHRRACGGERARSLRRRMRCAGTCPQPQARVHAHVHTYTRARAHARTLARTCKRRAQSIPHRSRTGLIRPLTPGSCSPPSGQRA